MTYRIFDKETKQWVRDNIFLTPDGGLVLVKKYLFGLIKILRPLSQKRYVYHEDIALCDKNGELIFVGDYLKAQVDTDKEVVGMVAYAEQLSAYVILCDDTSEFYTLGSDVAELVQIIGNVFDGYESV